MDSANYRKGEGYMSEKEKTTMERFLRSLSKLDDVKKNYILGLADGMALERESLKENSEREMAGAAV